ncbi:MAG TPA: type II secretion system protein [Pyrinomonadaceae bacterium]|jgi:type II secretory pathway pseudopilin PulG|nr:type II secretion system protein [Pyrinomonadaceae bacterium]
MKRQRMNNQGFTLIETTVAMLVMMIVGLSATSLFFYSVRNNSGASQRSVAMAVAQQRLEVLRGSDYYATALDFGVYGPETVVVAPATTTSYTQGSSIGGNQPYDVYDAPVAASNVGGGVNPNAQPTPTPTPTPGGGTTGGSAPSGSNTFQIQTEVVPFPIGVAAASAKQKQIMIRVVPVNGNGQNSWANQNPVVVIFRRSIGAPGIYKQ